MIPRKEEEQWWGRLTSAPGCRISVQFRENCNSLLWQSDLRRSRKGSRNDVFVVCVSTTRQWLLLSLNSDSTDDHTVRPARNTRSTKQTSSRTRGGSGTRNDRWGCPAIQVNYEKNEITTISGSSHCESGETGPGGGPIGDRTKKELRKDGGNQLPSTEGRQLPGWNVSQSDGLSRSSWGNILKTFSKRWRRTHRKRPRLRVRRFQSFAWRSEKVVGGNDPMSIIFAFNSESSQTGRSEGGDARTHQTFLESEFFVIES